MNQWLPYGKVAEGGRTRVLCFPPSGSGASFFASWRRHLRPEQIEILPVQLPGRETRLGESLIAEMGELVAAAVDGLSSELVDGQTVFFGHSMGGALAFELAAELRRRGGPQPVAVVVSACSPPHLGLTVDLPMANAREEDFLQMLLRLGATPPSLLEHPEFKAMIIPILRADLQACESYRASGDEFIDVPLVAVGGSDDRDVPPAHLSEWARYTTYQFRWFVEPGGHHYVKEPLGLDAVQRSIALAIQLGEGGTILGPGAASSLY